MDVAQGHVVHLRPADVAGQQHMVLAQHHGSFSTHGSPIYRHMPGQYGRNLRVQGLGPGVDRFGHPALDRLPHLFNGQAPRFFPAQYPAAPGPGNGHDLQRAGLGWYRVVLKVASHLQVRHLQGLENLHRRGPAHRIGEIVVANQQESGNLRFRQAGQAFGKFPLMSLGRVAAFIRVAG